MSVVRCGAVRCGAVTVVRCGESCEVRGLVVLGFLGFCQFCEYRRLQ